MLWSGVVFANESNLRQVGPHAFVDSATDDGGGKISVSWSLQSEPEGVKFENDLPGKVCVRWAVVTDGVKGADTSTCFTSEVSGQDDPVWSIRASAGTARKRCIRWLWSPITMVSPCGLKRMGFGGGPKSR